MGLTGTESYEMVEVGYLRVDLTDTAWVALMTEDGINFGGTLWQRGLDGFDYSAGCTAGYPVLGKKDATDDIARRVADFVLLEHGEAAQYVGGAV